MRYRQVPLRELLTRENIQNRIEDREFSKIMNAVSRENGKVFRDNIIPENDRGLYPFGSKERR